MSDDQLCLAVCSGAGCHSAGAPLVREAIEAAAHGTLRVKGSGCLGLCARGPLVLAQPTGAIYEGVTAESAPSIVAHALGRAAEVPPPVLPADMPFFARQHKIVLSDMGAVDPERIEDYLAVGGYEALRRALHEMTPQQVIDELTRSGLRGRGGAGYPTAVKWGLVARAQAAQKYVICNGDEGDPGAFMDRCVMDGDPHRVLEGMAIAGYAVGASQGYVYVRGEYPLAVQRLQRAIHQAERQGVLGARILDTPFQFRVDLRIGAGAYVCGEETALIASIEGGRGTPRARPPYPASHGLWGQPTLINNVETFANVPPIVRNGGDWYAAIGTEKSRGTKVFALAGKVANTGIVEVPFGIPLREIVYDLGGGVPDGRAFKAVQTGGPSGGCIPADYLDVPLDYESLSRLGAIVGSGGMIVMDDTSCMVDVARYFLEFSMIESCGKCVPCRAGTVQAFRLIDRMTHGQAVEGDLDQLERLCTYIQQASLCGLGQNAPNPVFSTLRYFRDEYTAHVRDRVCPAGVCPMRPEEHTA